MLLHALWKKLVWAQQTNSGQWNTGWLHSHFCEARRRETVVDNSQFFRLPSSFYSLFFHIYHHKQTHQSLSSFTFSAHFCVDATPLDPDCFPPPFSDWVVRKGLSTPSINFAFRACWKLLVQPLNTIIWHISTGNGGELLPTQTQRGIWSELVCWFHTALDKMRTLFFTCMLMIWLVAAFAWRSGYQSQLIPGSLPAKELNPYLSDHMKSKRARVSFFSFKYNVSFPLNPLW